MVSLTNAPCPVPLLAAGELRLWLADLDTAAGQFSNMTHLLSVDERERAARFRFDRDRRHYSVARAILRSLLAHYTGMPAAGIQFSYNAHGKPVLPGNHPCRFNVSHSHGWALYGFALERDVGVDIERIRPDLAGLEIAQRFFSATEVEALQSVAKADLATAFFNCWTRKEAFIKANGLGVFLGLHTFAVTLAPGAEAALLYHDVDPEAANNWMMLELQAPEGFVGAAAVAGKDVAVHYTKWHAPQKL